MSKTPATIGDTTMHTVRPDYKYLLEMTSPEKIQHFRVRLNIENKEQLQTMKLCDMSYRLKILAPYASLFCLDRIKTSGCRVELEGRLMGVLFPEETG